MSRGRLAGTIAVAIPVVSLVAVVSAWAIDGRVHDGQVPRNVEVAGRAIGGLGSDDLDAAVDELVESYPATAVRIELPGRTLDTTVGDLGASVDREATRQAALDARSGSLLTRPFEWVGSFFGADGAPVVLIFDNAVLADEIDQLEGDQRVDPIEPRIEFTELGYVPVPGVDGTGVDPRIVRDAVGRAATDSVSGAIVASTEQRTVAPRFTDEETAQLADDTNDLISAGIEVAVADETAQVDPAMLGPWLRSQPGPDALELAIVKDRVTEDLSTLLPSVGRPAEPARFTVRANKPAIVRERPGRACCAQGSARRILDALESGESTARIRLAKTNPDHDREWAKSLGIVEEITLPDEPGCSQFNAGPCRRTTHHDCCGSRVVNIQRMADIVRGTIIEPGGYFSINETVGERTTAKGFLSAGAIENGKHVQSVGGGVSQFATTSFNAAFFAGLDIPRYFFHDEYLSRYPYGRESTVSFPEPEFRIENNTPYGVLVWPEYTETSITIRLFSTRHASGAETGQSTSTRGNCTDVTTERTRTFVDGHTEVDSFSGHYRNNTNKPTC